MRWFAPTGARSRWTGRNRCGRWRIWCKKTSASCKKRGDEHVLTAAALCFPANWPRRTREQPLTGIHTPVEEYDADIA
ncbi:heme-dependent oxidative N-demethylase subunit alpha family protein, partial [Sulfitobacter pontiacus]